MIASMETIKDVFFMIGSFAGIFGLISPVIESKFQDDKQKLNKILENLSEDKIIILADQVWHSKFASFDILDKYDKFSRQMREKTTDVNFSGPLKNEIYSELKSVVSGYNKLREYIQVPYWNPALETDINGYVFDRSRFSDIGDDYVEHIEGAHDCILDIRNSLRKLQVLLDFHYYETFISRLILKSRCKKIIIAPYS